MKSAAVAVICLVLCLRCTSVVQAQSKVLPHSIHPKLAHARDLGRLDPLAPMEHMMLVLKATPEQEADLDQLLDAQQNPDSPDYQQWITPEQFGRRFGLPQQPIERISAWLRSHGMVVHEMSAGRRVLTFSGVADQVNRAFRTEMRRYEVNGQQHIANSTDLQIPEELSDVVEGVSLHSFRATPLHHVVEPDYTSGSSHYLTPYDYATIYNIAPLWTAGTDGTGQTVALVGRASVPQSDFAAFRSRFGLPASTLQNVTTQYSASSASGGDLVEATLDVEWAGAVAKGATIMLVSSTGSQTSDGVDVAAAYIVNNNLAPIMSISFGQCEAYLGSNNTFYQNTWRQAAAQGISVFVSTGDNGAGGCDSDAGPDTHGLQVNGLASTAYNVAVGGTQFNEGSGSYWNTTNDAHQASAKSYIPEKVWNESGIGGGSGGVSSQHATPLWQTGTGVPTGDPGATSLHHRYMPDVSLTAAVHDGYQIVQGGGVTSVGGTSASSPSFAGVMALVNQRTGSRNGLPLPRIYSLAGTTPAIFHDTTVGTNAMPCTSGTPNCSGGVLTAYAATTGYDLATGWGSVDVNALVTNWASATPIPMILGLLPNPMTGSSSAQPLTIQSSGVKPGSGLQVIASYAGGTPVTLQGSSITSATPAQIVASINTGTVSRAWNIQIVNPNGQSSNTVALTVNGAPVITSITPNPVNGSNIAQSLVVHGTGFVTGAQVIVGFTGYTQTLSGSAITAVTSTQINAMLRVGLPARTWTAQVVNPDGGHSNIVNFTVNAGPSITSVTPNPMTGNTVAQTITIHGTGFVSGSGMQVIAGFSGYSTTLTGATITSVTSTQVQALLRVGVTTRNWTVQVNNPDGSQSNVFPFVVNAP